PPSPPDSADAPRARPAPAEGVSARRAADSAAATSAAARSRTTPAAERPGSARPGGAGSYIPPRAAPDHGHVQRCHGEGQEQQNPGDAAILQAKGGFVQPVAPAAGDAAAQVRLLPRQSVAGERQDLFPHPELVDADLLGASNRPAVLNGQCTR